MSIQKTTRFNYMYLKKFTHIKYLSIIYERKKEKEQFLALTPEQEY